MNHQPPLPIRPVLRILGTRGVPARHGGFETFAEQLSLHAVAAGWDVHVYCQEDGKGKLREETWKGITRVVIPELGDSAAGTIRFDCRAAWHAAKRGGVCLTLGYNTAIFTLLLRLFGRRTVMNMDGIEWSRAKWSTAARAWLYVNEWLGARLNHVVVADHPAIGKHLERHTRRSKIRVIPYGAEIPGETDPAALDVLGLRDQRFAVVIARPEPENSILEIVQAWSRKPRGAKLVVLGNFRAHVAYHQQVRTVASDEVIFPGAIYERDVVGALRRNAWMYLHGHQVGGTNPSLVEALSYGNPVIAHENRFNRWVAGAKSRFFASTDECESCIEAVLSDSVLRDSLSRFSKKRHAELFSLHTVLDAYLAELSRCGYEAKLGMPADVVDPERWSSAL
ncbi:MAG: DUF1972 domain-containing protein [Fibrobacteres bacterium]|nr:DUF1972 domain-containing protein [Fibrobacterota bacterium]